MSKSRRPFNEKHIPKGIVARYTHNRNPDRSIHSTVCDLMDTTCDPSVVVITARSTVSPRDNGSKEIGRSVSLGRALKIYHLGV